MKKTYIPCPAKRVYAWTHTHTHIRARIAYVQARNSKRVDARACVCALVGVHASAHLRVCARGLRVCARASARTRVPLHVRASACVRTLVCVRVWARACVCVRACLCMCVGVCDCVYIDLYFIVL